MSSGAPGSAGAFSSLYLALHDDMADPKSDDPVARESTRLYCAAVNGAQVTLELVAAVRNKGVDAFNEIMRMQA